MKDFIEIPLTRGLKTKVSPEDYPYLSQFKWCALRRHKGFSAARGVFNKKTKKVKTILMHRQIMNFPKGMQIDHINLDPLDNNRKNLRVCTNKDNCRNKLVRSDSVSKIKGIRKRHGRWAAAIFYNNRQKWLGTFDKKADAIITYNNAAIKYFGEFARINTI